MDTRNGQFTDNLIAKVDGIALDGPEAFARALPLYIRLLNDDSRLVANISNAYIDTYDGKTVFRKFKTQFTKMDEMLKRNGMGESDTRCIFKRVANRTSFFPKNVAGMKRLYDVVLEEMQAWKKAKKSKDLRANLTAKFRMAIKKYLHLTYTMGFNIPSECARNLVENHKIDKYIMSGDFPLMLLPFLPELEESVKLNYEHYEMKDAWENLKGMYFNRIDQFNLLAIEIKRNFTQNIPNFSEYLDRLYTDTYYKLMLKRGTK